MKATFPKLSLKATRLHFPTRPERAASSRPRPPGALTSPASVSAHGWRSVEAPSEPRSLRPPPPAICQPASTTDSQPAAHRPAAARSPVVSLRAPASFFFCPRLRGPPRAGQRVRSRLSFGGKFSLVSASFVFQLPFKTYGENGQTSSYKPNFPAADSRRTEIPAGKSAEAAFPSR